MSRIFLSHSSRNNFEAIALRDWLAAEGWDDVFLDLDPERGIITGERWERALHQAATRCEAVLFLISRNWLASGWCVKEYSLARGLNKKLFAAIIDPTLGIDDLPLEHRGTWQAVDLASSQDMRIFRAALPERYEERHIAFSESGLRRLRLGLERAGLNPKYFAWPPEDEGDRAPYRGLKPLDAADAGVFFGRDAPIVEAIDLLRGLREAAKPRLLVLLGASGAGKSSFLRAGLLPRLARDDANFLPLPPIRPERAALTGDNGFLGALEAVLPRHTRAELRDAITGGAATLRLLLAALADAAFARTLADDVAAKCPTIVIAVDQAEELFRAEGAGEASALLTLLRELAVADEPSVIVLFAIRSDAYDALQHAPALDGLAQRTLPLQPMPRGAYKEVIEGPAQRMTESGGALTLEPQLTQRLLQDVEKGGGSDALPLLAFTLEQLYREHRRAGILRLVHYERSRGLAGAIEAAVERAFVRADADGRIPRERVAREALLRRGLIPWLAGIDPDTRNSRRNIARRADIPAEAAPLIELLVEERLLATDTMPVNDPATGVETRVPTIEPAHESLLRQWGLLQGWLEEDFGRLATLEGVKRAARDWNANARLAEWLIHGAQRLAEVRQLDTRPDIAVRLDVIDRRYLAECGAREAAQNRWRRRARHVKIAAYLLSIGLLLGLIGWIEQAPIAMTARRWTNVIPFKLAEMRPLTKEAERSLKSGSSFKECRALAQCPEMVVVPPGTILVGAATSDPDSNPRDTPQHKVTIASAFAVSKYPVTFEQWDNCVAHGDCPPVSDGTWGRGDRPVIHVTWDFAQRYVAWLSQMTGQTYRLLSEAEYEYVARAGTQTDYPWGEDIGTGHANCKKCGSRWDNRMTAPVGQFAPNAFGLYDMVGNVYTWVEDCHHRWDYEGAPTDGSAWINGGLCDYRLFRGGSWDADPSRLRVSFRSIGPRDEQGMYLGFRVARSSKVH